MRHVEIAGSYYELGLEYGKIVSETKLNLWWGSRRIFQYLLKNICVIGDLYARTDIMLY